MGRIPLYREEPHDKQIKYKATACPSYDLPYQQATTFLINKCISIASCLDNGFCHSFSRKKTIQHYHIEGDFGIVKLW